MIISVFLSVFTPPEDMRFLGIFLRIIGVVLSRDPVLPLCSREVVFFISVVCPESVLKYLSSE